MTAGTGRTQASVAFAGRPVVGGLAVVLLVGLFVCFAPFGQETAEATTVRGLNERLGGTQVQLRELRERIAEAELERRAALGDIEALDQRIEGLERDVRIADAAWESAAEELAQFRGRLDALTKDLNRKRAELARTEADLAARQEIFEARLAGIYRSGGRLAFMAALLEPGSIMQVLGRINLLNSIVRQDSDLISRIEELKAEVTTQKEALETRRMEISALEQQQRRVTAELEAKAAERRTALAGLENARAAKQRVVAAAERNLAAWNRQEDRLVAESRRITELLRNVGTGRPVSGSGTLAWPLDGQVSSGFGYRVHPIFHVRRMHTGIDIPAATGVPIRASAGGVVLSAGWRGGYGKCVVIDHGRGLSTLYAHMSQILVSEGQEVARGAIIGRVGSTGYSTGPHLHFEVRINGTPVNPLPYL